MNLKGADPRNGGRQPKDWLSGTLRGTFLTLTGSSRSWRSSTDVLDFAYCMSEIAPGGIFRFLSFESMFERNYLILPVSSSCLFFLRVSRLYGGTR